MPSVAGLESEIRKFLTVLPRQERLLEDEANWYKIAACLDAIGDTELALDSFLFSCDGQDSGQRHLSIYGALQALVLQQDAVRHLAEGLSIEYEPQADLREIREIRNDSVGHPTRRGGASGSSFTALCRFRLSAEGFEMMTTTKDPARHRTRRVNLPEQIARQRNLLILVLKRFLEQLNQGHMVGVDAD